MYLILDCLGIYMTFTRIQSADHTTANTSAPPPNFLLISTPAAFTPPLSTTFKLPMKSEQDHGTDLEDTSADSIIIPEVS